MRHQSQAHCLVLSCSFLLLFLILILRSNLSSPTLTDQTTFSRPPSATSLSLSPQRHLTQAQAYLDWIPNSPAPISSSRSKTILKWRAEFQSILEDSVAGEGRS
ncbi:hypothetical protein RchiOBHm_Chr2g0125181 [Rosa chinensis]|uniref:Uncharacterized protein n=1 Tax=Rosa chinensis TaxID=74649 RepID=A0A2P6RTJ0_ROSCH|nr:hypothetical protein RchiOBHm_Chr2g0125181 [Rosa chinensis]